MSASARVIPHPSATRSSTPVIPPEVARLNVKSMRELDAYADAAGVMGIVCGDVYGWQRDAPATMQSVVQVIRGNLADPLAPSPMHGPEVCRALHQQLLLQAESFAAIAAALASGNDAPLIGQRNAPGSGFAEAMSYVSTTGILDRSSQRPSERDAFKRDTADLADLFTKAAKVCARAARLIDAHRLQHHSAPLLHRIAMELRDREDAHAEMKRAIAKEPTP